ncbi:hypothetical protein CIHG_09731 [Coccidioides immitis H538.4]|uniref:Uncharacterized protein n=2 Tax=Coccidioides immitis TaxID=5501 RepID=A0A0J8S692_COCIT|nr:hypothetical protein CIRG_09432 [Coccidioides immitis RMSCC 2394]KMU91879.1 hypothetical protein CIHG_09731 [Coccidioides immitis H538.4]
MTPSFSVMHSNAASAFSYLASNKLHETGKALPLETLRRFLAVFVKSKGNAYFSSEANPLGSKSKNEAPHLSARCFRRSGISSLRLHLSDRDFILTGWRKTKSDVRRRIIKYRQGKKGSLAELAA